MTEVKSGDTVRMEYTGKLSDGAQFDSSAGREPLQFEVGAGQIIPGLDRQIEGMTVGEENSVVVPAAEAYGMRDETQVQTVPRSAVPEDVELAVGTKLQANTPDGRQVPLTVTACDDQQVTVDANHPLAGEDLHFDVKVVEIVE